MDLECSVCLDPLTEESGSVQEENPPLPPKRIRRISQRYGGGDFVTYYSPSSPATKSTTENAVALRPLPEICVAQCGHIFHKKCFLDWLKKQANCPTCRTLTTEEQLTPVYLSLSTEGKLCSNCKVAAVEIEKLRKENRKKGDLKTKMVEGQLQKKIDELEKEKKKMTEQFLKEKAQLRREAAKATDRAKIAEKKVKKLQQEQWRMEGNRKLTQPEGKKNIYLRSHNTRGSSTRMMSIPQSSPSDTIIIISSDDDE